MRFPYLCSSISFFFLFMSLSHPSHLVMEGEKIYFFPVVFCDGKHSFSYLCNYSPILDLSSLPFFISLTVHHCMLMSFEKVFKIQVTVAIYNVNCLYYGVLFKGSETIS